MDSIHPHKNDENASAPMAADEPSAAAVAAGTELATVPKTPRKPLLAERTDFLDGDVPAAAKVEAFLAQALATSGNNAPSATGALVPSICDVLLLNHSVKAYGRDLMDFVSVIRTPS
jgi:hypothetical protein